MGLENGFIPTSNISVSSQKNPQATVESVRMGNAKAWLAARNDSSPWIEILFSPRKETFFFDFNSKNNPLFLETAKNLTGFEISGDVTEITIQYDTLSAKNINYTENVCHFSFVYFEK